MARVLYDLAGLEDDRRLSPFCWRIKLSMAHKGLPFETIPWRFTEKDVIAFSGQGAVPVLVDGERTLSNSWDIATYLEENYPAGPSLFGGEAARALSAFITDWTERILHRAIGQLVLLDIHDHLHPKDRAYFRSTREKTYGAPLEEVVANREARLDELRKVLTPLRGTLDDQPFLGGARPLYADYVVFGAFQWARVISPIRLLAPEDPIYAWRERLLDAHDGLARQVRGYPV